MNEMFYVHCDSHIVELLRDISFDIKIQNCQLIKNQIISFSTDVTDWLNTDCLALFFRPTM